MDAPTDRDAVIPRAPYADADPLYHALTHTHAAPEFPAFTAADALALVDQCAALDLRLKTLRLNETTDAWRVISSDGDGLSGLTVDRYAAMAAEVQVKGATAALLAPVS